MNNAEFVVASGAMTVAGLRLGLRSLLPDPPAFLRKVSDDEAAAFLAAYARPVDADADAPSGSVSASP